MKAALFEAYRGPLSLRHVADPDCPADGVIVEVKACGVCLSDWHGWSGADPDVAVPHVPGHEFAGVVIEAGPECRRFVPGDRVRAPFIIACGQCGDCRGGEPTVCNHQHVIGFSAWGAFAEARAARRFQSGEAARNAGLRRSRRDGLPPDHRLPRPRCSPVSSWPFTAAAASGCRR